MGRNPHWGIERADYPYVDLLAKCSYWMNQDIPREGDDIYRIEDDQRLADEIKRLEKAYESHSEDFATVRAHRDVVSLLLYDVNFDIYSSCRAKPE